MAWFSKFKFLFALKLSFSWGQFYKEIPKFGYFKKWKKVRIKLEWLRKLSCYGNVIVLTITDLRNVNWYQPCEKQHCLYLWGKQMGISLPKSLVLDGWMGVNAGLRIAYSNQKPNPLLYLCQNGYNWATEIYL